MQMTFLYLIYSTKLLSHFHITGESSPRLRSQLGNTYLNYMRSNNFRNFQNTK